ncbi:MAG: YHS domain-containing protein [Candidatus Aminicenantes bacterium]|nr:YHS domain-containing protein [Candidatus Aminicenantes bacterium]
MRNYLILGLVLLVAGGLVAYVFSQEEVKDPVCGMKMKAAEAKFKSEYAGKTYYFCSADCKAKFDQGPEKYVGQKDKEMSAGMKSGMQAGMKCEEKMGMMSKMKPEMVCCAMKGEMMKEVKMERKDTPDGQIITMTSTNPEVVKKLQEMAKQCQEGKMSCQRKEMMGDKMEKKDGMTGDKEKKEMMAGHENMGKMEHMEHAGHAGDKGHGAMMEEGCCLMHNKNYTSTVTNIENGVRIEIKKK